MTPAILRELQQEEKMKDVVLVDVRSSGDFIKKHIEGAINIPSAFIGQAPLTKKNRVVLYCYGQRCPLAGKAARKLEKMDYTNVWVLTGGIAEWERLD